jgi:hypothetical protein
MFRLSRAAGVLAFVLLSAGCAEPPHKEMNQAQGAIDAARAAGAEQYATSELTAADDALRRSEQAAAQNDYRLALSLAIDSRERAQAAAKAAVERRAKARGNAERVVAEANSALTQARSRLTETALARLPRRTATDVRTTLATAAQSMQEARAALERDDYARATQLANDVSGRIAQTLAAIDKPAAAAAPRSKR